MISIGGFVPFSTTDFPGQMSAVVFCQGCPWRCFYCHNKHLQPFERRSAVEWSDVLASLIERKSFLDAVVFSGGEPCFQSQLPEAIRQVKNEGFKVGLHTGGANPLVLQEVLTTIDWLGLDIKCAEEDYAELTGVDNSGENAFTSLKLALKNAVKLEVRTTVDPDWHNENRLKSLAQQLLSCNVSHWVTQPCRADRVICSGEEQAAFSRAIETIELNGWKGQVHPDGRCQLTRAGHTMVY
jgi:pyruvate formate lyase activating enzyme